MNNTRISVLIPCYNQEKHIKHTIEAIINQTIKPDEIIVVDDGSTDRSVELIRNLPVILIQHQINKGPSVARNTALQNSSGDIVIYVDADAYADNNMIASILQAYNFPHNDKLAGVTGRGVEVYIKNIYDRWRSLHAKQDFGNKMRDNVPYPFGLCMSFFRDKLIEVGGFDPFYPINAGEDFDLGLRFTKAGYWLRYWPDAIVYHQHSDTNESLRNVQYNWYYWSYIAKKRNHSWPSTLIFGIFRRLIIDTIIDILIYHDIRLAKLNFEIFKIKFSSLKKARLYRNQSQ